jgi:hypothetical protein
VHDSAFMHAIEFLSVDLEGIDEGRGGRGQTQQGRAQYGTLVARAPPRHRGAHRLGIGRVGARDAHAQRVMQECPRGVPDVFRQIRPAQPQRMIDQRRGGIAVARSRQCGSSPPETFMLSAVMYAASSEQRNATAPAVSDG